MSLLKVLPIFLVIFISGCASQISEINQSPEEQAPTEQAAQETPTQQPTGGVLQGEVTPQEQSPSPIVKEYTIEITKTGFSTITLTIKLGDKVTFINKDVAPHWPASAVHPTHCEYKGCGAFDAKRGLAPSEPYSIVFDLAGSWKYHDHLNPGMTGTIVVR